MDLNRQIDNNTTVADWLGTAHSNAAVATSLIEQIRLDDPEAPDDWADHGLRRAEDLLVEALAEVRMVRVSDPEYKPIF